MPVDPTEPEAPAISRSSVVAVRLVLLAVAAAAVALAVLIGVGGRDGDASGARYVCPMHPEVTARAPGQCPICRMALEPVTRDQAGGPRPAMGGMVDTTAVENVRKHKILDFVRVHSLLPNLRDLRGPAWVESDGTVSALFYEDQIAELAADEPGTFTPTQTPGIGAAVRRLPDRAVTWDRSTSRIRFRAPGALPPGQVGWLEIARKTRDVLGVPASAILQSPEGPYVLVPLGGGRFEKRRIAIGETFLKQGFAVVLSGLHRNDLVVSRATFFLDADRRLDIAESDVGMAGPRGAKAASPPQPGAGGAEPSEGSAL